MELKKRILVAPLNWGLGHATRCIPIIEALIQHNFEPILASDGESLTLLKKEFPILQAIELPSYEIKYAKKGKNFKLKLIKHTPKLFKAVKAEKKQLKGLLKTHHIDGIISDNRLGIYSKKVPSVFVSHQLNVLSGATTWFSTKLHQHVIKKFDECWVPDVKNEPSLSGRLGRTDTLSLPIKYLGAISRFEIQKIPQKYDLMVLLSGPEPQRTLLENQLLDLLPNYDGNVLFVKGKVVKKQKTDVIKNMTVVNFMKSDELELALNSSSLILSRPGYTTILDLAKLQKSAFFIPTPGQFEQEYLAQRLDKNGLIPHCTQDEFTLDQLNRVKNYKGFEGTDFEQTDIGELFHLFERK